MTPGWASRAAARASRSARVNQPRTFRRLLGRQQEFLDRHDPVQELIVPAPHPP